MWRGLMRYGPAWPIELRRCLVEQGLMAALRAPALSAAFIGQIGRGSASTGSVMPDEAGHGGPGRLRRGKG